MEMQNIFENGTKVLVIDGYGRSWVKDVVLEVMREKGTQVEWIYLYDTVQGCIACGKCNRRNRCVYEDDVNCIADKANEIGGMLILCPLYYGRADENVTAFVTRLMRSASRKFAFLPCAVLHFSRNDEKNHIVAIDELLAMADMFILHEHGGNVIFGKDEQYVKRTCDVLCWMAKCMNHKTRPELPGKVKDFVR